MPLTSWPNIHFRTISQPWALSADIPAARRGLFTKGWFTLSTESETESEAEEALRSSVNQKSEARRNRSQKDQKSFFLFRLRSCFRRFRRVDSH